MKGLENHDFLHKSQIHNLEDPPPPTWYVSLGISKCIRIILENYLGTIFFINAINNTMTQVVHVDIALTHVSQLLWLLSGIYNKYQYSCHQVNDDSFHCITLHIVYIANIIASLRT